MNTTADNTFFRVESEEPVRIFRIKVEWQKELMKILILENSNAWSATVTNEDIKTLANTLECDNSVYKTELQQYFSKKNSLASYNIVNKQFIIYRNEKKLRIKYFVKELMKVNYEETVQSFIDTLLRCYELSENKVKTSKHEKIEAENQKICYEEKCNEFIRMKQKIDLKIYSSVLLLLNKKKEYISFLTELNKMQKRKTLDVTYPMNSNKNLELKTNNKHKLSDSESNNEDYNTDDETNTKIDNNIDFDHATHSLGCLTEDDSPPPASLPKRIKKENNDTFERVPSSDCLLSRNHSDEIQVDMVNNDTDEGSDSYNMNTQELLDRM